MPRKTNIDPQQMLDVLKSCNIFDENNILKPRSNEVWKSAATSFLPKQITSDTLNFYVRNNRWNLLNDLKLHFDISICEVSENDSTIISAGDSSLEYVPYNYIENKNVNYPLLLFNLELTENEWKCIYPEDQLYKDNVRGMRVYKKLKSGWTDMIVSKNFAKTKSPCAFIFDSGKVFVSPEAAVYVHIHGVCKECDASFDAHCLNEPAPGDGIIFSVRTFDTRQIPHDAKKPVKGILRADMGKELLFKKPRTWRNQATDNISFGDCEPPTLPRDATLRKIREEAMNKKLGINSSLDVVNSLCELKYRGKYTGYIKEVSKDRFHCFYWSPMQMSLHNSLIRKFKKIDVDGTGSLVKMILAHNGEKRAIFLYQMIIAGEKEVQPVFQMLSEKHDANLISYWMREILRNGATPPPEVNCDYSMALLNATSLAYNEMSLKKYLLKCFEYVTSDSTHTDLKCLIRVDIAHLIKIMCRKEVFRGTHPRVKDFFVRCVGVMSICDNMEDLLKLLRSLLIVAGSQYTGKNVTNEDVVCARKYDFLIERIETFTYSDENEDPGDDEKRDYNYLDNDCDDNPDIIDFFDKIFEDCQREIDFAEETKSLNTYYCPGIIDHVKKLARHFPIWTNVMLKHFTFAASVPSTAKCEAYFKRLKHSDLGPDYRPLRADKFIVEHIKSIESSAKLEKAKSIQNRVKIAYSNKQRKIQSLKKSKIDTSKNGKSMKRKKASDWEDAPNKKKTKNQNESNSRENEHLNYQENWFGKNWEAKQKIVSCELSDDSEVDQMQVSNNSIEKAPFTSSPLEANNNNFEKKNNNSPHDETIKISDNEIKTQNERESPLTENKVKPVRGKYVRPCPNVKLIYDRPLRKRHGEIIQNGNSCSPVFIEGVKIYVKNTCGFDAPAEIIASSYSNYSKFKNEIDIRQDNLFFSFICKYTKNGVSSSLNQDRAEILSMIFEIKNSLLDCFGSSPWILEKLILDTPSVVVHKRCSTCKIVNRKIPILNMAESHGDLDSNFQTHLQNFVTDIVDEKNKICRKCESPNTVTTTVGPYLIIDPEMFFHSNMTRYPKGITLSEIPEKLNVKNEVYILGGLVRHTPAHFSAVCRNPNNTWHVLDGMCTKAQIVTNAKKFIFVCSEIVYIKL